MLNLFQHLIKKVQVTYVAGKRSIQINTSFTGYFIKTIVGYFLITAQPLAKEIKSSIPPTIESFAWNFLSTYLRK
jgi:hypothetical protein